MAEGKLPIGMEAKGTGECQHRSLRDLTTPQLWKGGRQYCDYMKKTTSFILQAIQWSWEWAVWWNVHEATHQANHIPSGICGVSQKASKRQTFRRRTYEKLRGGTLITLDMSRTVFIRWIRGKKPASDEDAILFDTEE